MTGPSERACALLLGLAYLLVGAVGWWWSPPADLPSGLARDAGMSMLGLWLTTFLLVAFALAPSRDRIVTWLGPAVVGPLALAPLMLHRGDASSVVVALLWPAVVTPLGLVLAGGGIGRAMSLAALAAAVVLGLGVVVAPADMSDAMSILRYVAVIAIVALPGLDRLSQARMIEATTVVQITARAQVIVAVVAPSLAGLVLVTSVEVGAAVLLTALGVTAGAALIAVRPLSWVAARDGARRGAVLAANEADRRRLAADLHDGPLQDALLLARRLDDAGDADGAAVARGIAAELRDLSGDLRLPMLDDLGVGPSLEWLAGRARRTSAMDVRVEVDAAERVPAPVELAAYRIAQEALANAVRHGAPPIVVRCRTAPEALSMTVADAGPGPMRETGIAGSPPLRLGISSMRQRAEQIGADLAWSRATGGGTVVTLEWRGRGG